MSDVRSDDEIVDEVLRSHGIAGQEHWVRNVGQFRAYMLEVAARVREECTEPVIAAAGDWEVTHVTDESGVWRHLQVMHPPSDEDEGVRRVAASLLLSDVEASELADDLMEPRA